jgi:molybdenum cofactor biosynthesis enzyme MoaA
MSVTITGGEPLLRREWREIVAQARGTGCAVTLFTNATLVTAEVARELRCVGVNRVEVSDYGDSDRDYGRTTGHPEAFEKFRAGVKRLLPGA